MVSGEDQQILLVQQGQEPSEPAVEPGDSGRIAVGVVAVPVLCLLYTSLYNRMVLGGDYAFLALPRVIKNLCLFPAESFLLLLFLNVMRPITNRMGFTYGNQEKLRFTKRHVIGLIVLTLVSAAAVAFYSYYRIHLK